MHPQNSRLANTDSMSRATHDALYNSIPSQYLYRHLGFESVMTFYRMDVSKIRRALGRAADVFYTTGIGVRPDADPSALMSIHNWLAGPQGRASLFNSEMFVDMVRLASTAARSPR